MKTTAPQHLWAAGLARMLAAMGAGQRLWIVRLLSAHPGGLPAGELQAGLGIPASTLSHHLEKLRQAGVIRARRKGTFLWYTVETEALQRLLSLFYNECCIRNAVIRPGEIAPPAGQEEQERTKH